MMMNPRVFLVALGLAAVPLDSMACTVVDSTAQAEMAARCNAPEPADGRVSAAQIDMVMTWITSRFDLPKADVRPAIVFEDPVLLARMRRSGFVAHRDLQRRNDQGERSGEDDIVALYNDARLTIHLPEGWSAASHADMSVLVHEMVHHLQNMADLKYRCPGEREKLAYQAQSAWLRQFDKSLDSEFGLDALTLLVRSNCL